MLQGHPPSAGHHRTAAGHVQPPPEETLKCPRCDSINTKFCYYNNYSLTQPRHFCKNCRRYWTKGGCLRNVPVGGGCRKNKRLNQQGPPRPDSNPAISCCNSSFLPHASTASVYPALPNQASNYPYGFQLSPSQESAGVYGSFSQPSLVGSLPPFDTNLAAMALYPGANSIKQETNMLYNSSSFNSLFAEDSTGPINLAAMGDHISTYNTSTESYDETLGLHLAQSRIPYHKLAMQLLNSVQNGEQAGENFNMLPAFVSGAAASSSDQSCMDAGWPAAHSPHGSADGPALQLNKSFLKSYDS